MDTTFRQTWYEYSREKRRSLSDSSNTTNISKSSSSSSSLNFSRQQSNRNNTNKITMDIIEDETTDPGESDIDDNHHPELASPRINSIASSETGDETDISISYVKSSK